MDSAIRFLVAWAPFIFMMFILAVIFIFARRQQKSYGVHLAEVSRINQETVTLNREIQALAREQLAVLKDIKAALERGRG